MRVDRCGALCDHLLLETVQNIDSQYRMIRKAVKSQGRAYARIIIHGYSVSPHCDWVIAVRQRERVTHCVGCGGLQLYW